MNADSLIFEHHAPHDGESYWVIYEVNTGDYDKPLYKIYNVGNVADFNTMGFAERIIKDINEFSLSYALIGMGAVPFLDDTKSTQLRDLCERIQKKYKK